MNSREGPRLGIFWIVGGEIVSYSVALGRAEHIGGYSNYAHGHAQIWPMVIRSHPCLRGVTYDRAPRGRVTYDASERRFNLLVPSAIACTPKLVSALITRFGLCPYHVTVLADVHYDPPSHQS